MIQGSKADFPFFAEHLQEGRPVVYLDNAATTQKPYPVIDAVRRYLTESVANPHRGAYQLSGEATSRYEAARSRVAAFLNATSSDTVVFTKNATDSLNLVAESYGRRHVGEGDEIIISIAEHHSNLLPWQRLAQENGALLKYVYLNETGMFDMEQFRQALTDRTKIVAVTQVSNVTGIEFPVAEIVRASHDAGAVVVVDAAQSAPHIPIDVQALGADFLAFSGHKLYGPDGAGVLYGATCLLQDMPPISVGGGIVEEVTERTVRYMDPPLRFEAGTPNVEAAVGLHAALDYVDAVGFSRIRRQEQELTGYLVRTLQAIPGVSLYGGTEGVARHGVVSFNVGSVHPHDVATILDSQGVAIRAGHHCAQPLLNFLGIRFCCRASLSFMNTKEDIDALSDAIISVGRWFDGSA